MGCLDELEKKLNIKPLEFRKWEVKSSLPNKKEEKKENEYSNEEKEFLEEKFLDPKNIDFTKLSNKFRSPKNNIIDLYNHAKSIYQNINNTTEKEISEKILKGLLLNNISVKEINDMIANINKEKKI